ncbi:tetratricopeptide repeat protein [Roseibacillus ishigakijimensis]|uniref:Tetratricopeptide repeat protein n=1 Tax=Roseibacillus ishigakijimensis TaxID=454146 RepID=A0A934VN61_9BACT|nr:hypothetical protein [Roseibacillus ishigakijimensis]MBK1834977.1 hypothetical protein [Roseibacillus ishigakijimensis]
MSRSLLLALLTAGALQGLAFSQEAPAQNQALPAHAERFSNLPEETRKEYGQHRLKAEQFFRQKRIFEALDQIHQGLAVFDEDPNLWNLKGSCHVEFRSFEKALEAFEKAYAIDSRNSGYLFNIAEMHFVLKNWEECLQGMAELRSRLDSEVGAAEKMPEPVLNLYRLSLFKSMLCHLKLGNEEKAREIATANSVDFDDTPFTYYAKAALAFHEDDREAASDWIRSAVTVFGGVQNVANWQDTIIEFGYVKSLYGGGEEEEELATPDSIGE